MNRFMTFDDQQPWSPPIGGLARRKKSFKDILAQLGLGLIPAAGSIGGALLGGERGATLGGSLGGLLGAGLEGLMPRREPPTITYKGYPLHAYPDLQLRPEAAEYYARGQQQEPRIWDSFPTEDIASQLGQMGIDELLNYVKRRGQDRARKSVEKKVSGDKGLQESIVRMILGQSLRLR